jgi:hypothetical protein
MDLTRRSRNQSSADFPAFAFGSGAVAAKRSGDGQVCCIAGFSTRQPHHFRSSADLEIGDPAGLETCATARRCVHSHPKICANEQNFHG